MTSTQPLPDNLEAALATIVTRLNNIDQNIGGLNERIDRVTNECPSHRTQTAINQQQLVSLEKELATLKTDLDGRLSERKRDFDDQIRSLWSRLWQVALGAAGTGAVVTGLIIKFTGGKL